MGSSGHFYWTLVGWRVGWRFEMPDHRLRLSLGEGDRGRRSKMVRSVPAVGGKETPKEVDRNGSIPNLSSSAVRHLGPVISLSSSTLQRMASMPHLLRESMSHLKPVNVSSAPAKGSFFYNTSAVCELIGFIALRKTGSSGITLRDKD